MLWMPFIGCLWCCFYCQRSWSAASRSRRCCASLCSYTGPAVARTHPRPELHGDTGESESGREELVNQPTNRTRATISHHIAAHRIVSPPPQSCHIRLTTAIEPTNRAVAISHQLGFRGTHNLAIYQFINFTAPNSHASYIVSQLD